MNTRVTTDAVTTDFLQAFGDAWNRHDIEALMAAMADDCEFHAVAGPDLLGKSFIGRDAVRAGFELAWQTFPDAAWLHPVHFVSGDRGVTECTFSGTKADGTRIEARMVDIFTFRDGKIAVKNAFRKDRPPVVSATTQA
ncbi:MULTISPECIES: nuclear transport factor 2 family protein [unclassified Janthinobacterium]|uniref:nuclear transport factor 2 family protein n=1 Tax=unclassified Janthinobacterium TaxID=2610881 RepID=UPI0008810D92|nr:MULTISPECIES: nuclear transport factor 2 family protein [unclassified Janthinobacterium]SDA86364.1 Ketosteroid isomerase-related protein [Janthinobacterium sp. 551a]SFB66119.1 Ketosteroid isomerase-related protein [Janthinobacterium sp. 344]